MKRIALIIILLCCIKNVSAQSETPVTTKEVDYITFYYDIPKNFHLKDKIIVTNNSNYYIDLVSVAVYENEQFRPLGSGSGLVPGKNYEIVSYKKNELRKIRKKKIAIKMKGFKSLLDNGGTDFINIKPNELQIRAYESRHDLIIDVFNSLF